MHPNDRALSAAQWHHDRESFFDAPEDEPKSPCCNAELSRKGRCYGCGAIYESMKTGIQLITEERERQITQEGWTPEHDDQHSDGELATAGACYAFVPRQLEHDIPEKPPEQWPWDAAWWKPCPNDRIRELTKAGALIAAEIDRLQRANA